MAHDEERLWWSRGYYLGAIISAVETYLAEIAPSPEQAMALSVMFQRETQRTWPPDDADSEESRETRAAFARWREDRILRGAAELRALLAAAQAACTRTPDECDA
jgi:hypothetical protein